MTRFVLGLSDCIRLDVELHPFEFEVDFEMRIVKTKNRLKSIHYS